MQADIQNVSFLWNIMLLHSMVCSLTFQATNLSPNVKNKVSVDVLSYPKRTAISVTTLQKSKHLQISRHLKIRNLPLWLKR